MPLQLSGFRAQHEKLDPTPFAKTDWGPPNMANFIHEAISNVIPNLQKSYQSTVAQVNREKQMAALKAYGLGQPGGPYGGAPTTLTPNQPFGPQVPKTGIPAAYTTENPTAVNLQPHEAGFLNAVAGPESGGKYNIRYGGKAGPQTFDDFSKHPGIFEEGPHGRSSAAGRYQITQTTWNQFADPGMAFTPENQDLVALRIARHNYNSRTGRDFDADLKAEGFTPRMAAVLAPTWRGLAGNAARVGETYKKTATGWSTPEVTTVQPSSQPQYNPRLPTYSGPHSRNPVPAADQPAPGASASGLTGSGGTTSLAGGAGGDTLAGGPTAPLPPARPADAPPAGNTDRTEAYKQRLVTAFPNVKITSEYRSPEHNQRVGGAQSSQHMSGRAIDISTQGLTQEQQQAIIDDAVAQGARGIGHYGGSMHIDFRDGPAAAWGPNRSRTSLGETPPWFQQRANALLGSGGPGTPAGGGGAPGGFSVEGLQAALAQAPPQLRAAFEALAGRVPGGMNAILGQLTGMVNGGGVPGMGGTGGSPGGAGGMPAVGAPQQVSQQVPGAVTQSPPTQGATASGQNAPPLFQSEPLQKATTGASMAAQAQPGQPVNLPDTSLVGSGGQDSMVGGAGADRLANQPAPGAQPAGLIPDNAFFIPPAPGTEGPGEIVPVGEGIDAGNVASRRNAGGGPGPAPARAPLPPPLPPPRPAPAASPPFVPTGGDSTYAASEDYRRAVAAGLITPDGQIVGGAGPAAAGGPPAGGVPGAGGGGGLPPGLGPGGVDRNLLMAAAYGVGAGDPGMANLIMQSALGKGGDDWRVISDGQGGFIRYNQRTGTVDQSGGGGDGQGDMLLQPNDPLRKDPRVNIPDDGRTWRFNLRTGKKEPIDNPRSNENPEFTHGQKLREVIYANPQYKTFQAGSQALEVLHSNFDQGNAAGDLAAIFNFMRTLDPNSAVREGEQDAMRGAGGPYAALWSLYNNAIGSGPFTADKRRQFYNTAVATLNAQGRSAQEVVDEQRRIAAASGLNPDHVSTWKAGAIKPVQKTTKDPQTGEEVETFRNKAGLGSKIDKPPETGKGSIRDPLVVPDNLDEEAAEAWLRANGRKGHHWKWRTETGVL